VYYDLAEFLPEQEKDLSAVTGYQKEEKTLHDKLEKLFSIPEGNKQHLNNYPFGKPPALPWSFLLLFSFKKKQNR
jgi:hypothetical protein